MQVINDINALANRFESKMLPKEDWTHFAHIAVAFVMIDKYKHIDTAMPKLRTSIIQYNESIGTKNTDNSGYHETLTIFWLKVVNEYIQSNPSLTSQATYEQFIQTELSSTNLLNKFYNTDLLFSVTARKNWIAPDKLPLMHLKQMIDLLSYT